ncbi:MAG: host attachment protein [Methylobacteriaceae bacterium]|nr:host attachment protein [Methylobacteriaceae bacterium]
MAHVTIKHGDWVFVGDGRKALLLRNEGDPDLLDLRRVEARERDEHAPSGEQGRNPSATSTDWHALEEERFAATVAKRLNGAAEEGKFRHIVIVAPPKVLGELRREYSKKLQGMILAEIDKDLTHHTTADIAKVLGVRGV